MRIALTLIAIVAIFGLVGYFDYKDELLQQQHYCSMVKDGHWPAYKPQIRCQP